MSHELSAVLQPSRFRDFPSTIRRALVTVAALGMLGIVAYRITAVLIPPPLAIDAPHDRSATSSRTVVVRGTTAPGAALTINGRPFIPDPRGAFTAEVVLLPGVNAIELEARTAHSWPARITRYVHVITAEGPVAISTTPHYVEAATQ